MASFFTKCSKFDENFKNGEKNQKMFLDFQMTAFDIVPADSKQKKEKTCDKQSVFQ